MRRHLVDRFLGTAPRGLTTRLGWGGVGWVMGQLYCQTCIPLLGMQRLRPGELWLRGGYGLGELSVGH